MVSGIASATPVLIVNWNSWEETFACLRSLQESGEDCPAWLIDNGSDIDRTAEAQSIYPNLRILKLDDNYGAAGARNHGLKLAAHEGYEFAFLIDNDCTVTPGFLSTALEAATANRRIAVAGSRVAFADVPNSLTYDGTVYARGEHPIDETDEVKVVSEVATGAALYRLAAMEDVGYFDERFFIYGEGREWCSRLADRGWSAAIAGGSLVYHQRHRSDHFGNEHYYRTRNYFLQRPRESGGQRVVRLTRYVYRVLREANERRRTGDSKRAHDMVDGLWDGLLGRFGRRATGAPWPISYFLARFWIFPMGFFRTRALQIREIVRVGAKPSR